MRDRVGVAVHTAAGEVGVAGVDIQAVLARNERKRLVEVGAEFLNRARLAGVVAGGLNAAAFEFRAGFFEPADIIALPAMQGDRRLGEGFEGGFGVHAEGGVLFAGRGVVAHKNSGGNSIS